MQELVLIQPGRTAESDVQRGATEAALRREFEERLAECGPLAFRVARGVLHNTADAEDVAQDGILRAYRRFDKLRDRARFKAWLVRITFRLALDRAKSSHRRQHRETLWLTQNASRLPQQPKILRQPISFDRAWITPWTSSPKSSAWSCCCPPSKVTPWKKSRPC